MSNFKEAYLKAINLPTHIEGILQPHSIMYDSNAFGWIVYDEEPTPVNIFKATERLWRNQWPHFFIRHIPQYRENGTRLPKKFDKQVLMSRGKWQRTEQEIINVTFDVVGIKRTTTHLGAGVYISNIKFS